MEKFYKYKIEMQQLRNAGDRPTGEDTVQFLTRNSACRLQAVESCDLSTQGSLTAKIRRPARSRQIEVSEIIERLCTSLSKNVLMGVVDAIVQEDYFSNP